MVACSVTEPLWEWWLLLVSHLSPLNPACSSRCHEITVFHFNCGTKGLGFSGCFLVRYSSSPSPTSGALCPRAAHSGAVVTASSEISVTDVLPGVSLLHQTA